MPVTKRLEGTQNESKRKLQAKPENPHERNHGLVMR